MVYITGGGAWEQVKTNTLAVAEVGPAVFGQTATGSNSSTSGGWTIGGGYETFIAPNWTVRAEYLYYDFNHSNTQSNLFPLCAVAGCGVNVTSEVRHINVVRAGVNYKF